MVLETRAWIEYVDHSPPAVTIAQPPQQGDDERLVPTHTVPR